MENRNGGGAEMWAGLTYTFGVPADRPALTNADASLAVQMAGTTYVGANGYYDLLVKDTRNGRTTQLRRAQAVGRDGGTMIPLYLSISGKKPPAALPHDNIAPTGNGTSW